MSNKIQEFQFSVDLLRAILWQYNVAENLQGILERKKDWYVINHEQFWSDWYRDVFNMDTANSFGLSVWAIILGIPLVVTSDTPNQISRRGDLLPHIKTLITETSSTISGMRLHSLLSRSAWF
ncbi:DUF2612 domain-containing protein [Escherichia albertii]|uniref:DUF2612 domain-containing protein n=1 Tax=Escherichia albertii TaxID=208962 RepID=UPI0007435EA3|nr:DUF2612 domain-containing protein [Escherichia albertii]